MKVDYRFPRFFHLMIEGRTGFAQLTWRESLRDIKTCLAAFGPKKNFRRARRYSRPVDKSTGLETQPDYPAPLRRIGYRDPETGQALVFLTNNLTRPALMITHLYPDRWQIELFFKWLKQHLRSNDFYGTRRHLEKNAHFTGAFSMLNPTNPPAKPTMFIGFLNRAVAIQNLDYILASSRVYSSLRIF